MHEVMRLDWSIDMKDSCRMFPGKLTVSLVFRGTLQESVPSLICQQALKTSEANGLVDYTNTSIRCCEHHTLRIVIYTALSFLIISDPKQELRRPRLDYYHFLFRPSEPRMAGCHLVSK